MTTKEIKTAKVIAKKEINANMTNSPIFWLHQFNKAVRKNTAIDGVVLENVKTLWKVANDITGRGFDFSLIPQNTNGALCKLVKATAKGYRGGELVTKYDGIEYELQPVRSTANGIMDAVASYLAYYAHVCEEIASPTKEAKKMTKAEVFALFREQRITEAEFIEMYDKCA